MLEELTWYRENYGGLSTKYIDVQEKYDNKYDKFIRLDFHRMHPSFVYCIEAKCFKNFKQFALLLFCGIGIKLKFIFF